jgi:beta-phosphoglucomutase-like phosphatase (HAD superfamily)
VFDFVRRSAALVPVAIASGALRPEIEAILERTGLRDCFGIIVSSEDVTRCKPDPEPFLTALARLNAHRSVAGRNGPPLRPAECLVVEDSLHGVCAARAAGMRCLAVTNSYPAEALARASRVVKTLEGLEPADLFTTV